MAVRLARMAELPVSLEEMEDEGSRGFLDISAEDVEVQMDEPEDGDDSFESEEIQFQVVVNSDNELELDGEGELEIEEEGEEAVVGQEEAGGDQGDDYLRLCLPRYSTWLMFIYIFIWLSLLPSFAYVPMCNNNPILKVWASIQRQSH